MTRPTPPTRTLRDRPDLDQLKRQAKELLREFLVGDAEAVTEVGAHYRGATAATFALHDAQLVLARAYGFDSWPKLKAYVDGVTIGRLIDAVRAGDLATATSMITARPELIHMDRAEDDEQRALHAAVLSRQPAIVRLLMQHGADARKGIWPHRDATSPLTLASERGDTEIVAIIGEEEQRRSGASDREGLRARVGASLVRREAEPAIRRAIATGDIDAIRARLNEPGTDRRGLVTFAVTCRQPESLAVLLGAGLDPDERDRIDGVEEVVWSWGEPLRECAGSGQHAMARILLEHGANPNTNVYAASSAMQDACLGHDSEMVKLLERHGGFINATTAGYLGLVDRARQLFEDERAGRLPDGAVGRSTVSEDVLEAAADAAHVELVRMALDHLDWPPGDPRWQGMLMRPLGAHSASDRERYLTCFRMIVDRSGVNLPGRSGRTLLHDVAANWPRSAPMGADDRVAFATILLDRGASLTARDDLLKSTPLGWACRWGQLELIQLLLSRGADPIEADAESWATPLAWAERMNHRDVRDALKLKIAG